jgi:hypothetical protein
LIALVINRPLQSGAFGALEKLLFEISLAPLKRFKFLQKKLERCTLKDTNLVHIGNKFFLDPNMPPV